MDKTFWGIFDVETNTLQTHMWSQQYVSRGCVYETEKSATRGLVGIVGRSNVDKFYVAEFKPFRLAKNLVDGIDYIIG